MSKVPGVTSFDGIPPDGATCSNDGQTGTVAGRVPSRGGDLCRSMPAPHHSTTPLHPTTAPRRIFAHLDHLRD